MSKAYGWRGTRVRHKDGRAGVIAREDAFFGGVDLHIDCEDGSKAQVRLNARSADTGEAGWQWWCPEFSPGPAWLPVGELGGALEYGQAPATAA